MKSFAIVTLEPLTESQINELVGAARAVASEGGSAMRLWWAKPDYNANDAQHFIDHSVSERMAGTGETFAVRDEDGLFIGCVSASVAVAKRNM